MAIRNQIMEADLQEMITGGQMSWQRIPASWHDRAVPHVARPESELGTLPAVGDATAVGDVVTPLGSGFPTRALPPCPSRPLCRDRFFALLGLALDANEPEFAPDHDSPLETIVRKFASAFVRQGKGACSCSLAPG